MDQLLKGNPVTPTPQNNKTNTKHIVIGSISPTRRRAGARLDGRGDSAIDKGRLLLRPLMHFFSGEHFFFGSNVFQLSFNQVNGFEKLQLKVYFGYLHNGLAVCTRAMYFVDLGKRSLW